VIPASATSAIDGPAAEAPRERAWLYAALVLTGALLAFRIAALSQAAFELDFEEAQYWAWSRELALGYFSKPPLIAWIIRLAEATCGSSEFCIRAPAAILYAGAGLFVFAAGARLYDAATGFLACALVALAPGIVFSARLITTDVPMLFCIALTLAALARLRDDERSAGAAVLAGLGLGLGLLAKYAMLFVPFGVALLAVWRPEERRWLVTRHMVLAAAIGFAIAAPNLLWNAVNGFVTFGHSGEVLARRGLGLRLGDGLEFVAVQFALLGPITAAAALAGMLRVARSQRSAADRFLVALAAPPFLIVTADAILFRAYANWAAAGALPAMLLAAAVLRAWRPAWMHAALAIGLAVQVALAIGDAAPDRVRLPFLSERQQPYARLLGWSTLRNDVANERRASGAAAVATDTRSLAAALTYYGRADGTPIHAWSQSQQPGNYYEMTSPLTARTAAPVLFVSACPDERRLAAGYASVTPLGEVRAPISLGRAHLFRLDGAREPWPLLPGCFGRQRLP
jgi:4-amino-4-deoxy-L-arabinose transferase-like glycosyltransferase